MLNVLCNRLNMVSDLTWQDVHSEQHVILLVESYERVCQKNFPITAGSRGLAYTLYHHPDYVLVSHGTEVDPIFNYANLAAQGLWQMDWKHFTQLPSRLSAQAIHVNGRAELLKAALDKGYIDNYEGIRVDAKGKEFYIKGVTLWNLMDGEGRYQGQAALFKTWEYL
jgi:hypothetical protein